MRARPNERTHNNDGKFQPGTVRRTCIRRYWDYSVGFGAQPHRPLKEFLSLKCGAMVCAVMDWLATLLSMQYRHSLGEAGAYVSIISRSMNTERVVLVLGGAEKLCSAGSVWYMQKYAALRYPHMDVVREVKRKEATTRPPNHHTAAQLHSWQLSCSHIPSTVSSVQLIHRTSFANSPA